MKSCHPAAIRSDQVIAAALPYSVLLREHTRAAHEACEQAMDLAGALDGPGPYHALLRRMQTAYLLLAADSRFREGEILVGRRGSIAADLQRLAYDLEDEPPCQSFVNPQPLATQAGAIGSQYVLAGSRLGSRVIVKRMMARLPAARATFFKGDDGDEVLPWRAFQRRLDDLGRSGQYDYAEVRRGAEQTFDLIAQALSGRLRCQ
jgi:heme oxygenase